MAVGHIYITGYKVARSLAPQPHLTSWYLDTPIQLAQNSYIL
jgi:hypothetical protein